MYIGVFDLHDRLKHTRKILNEKKQLKRLLEEDIQELEEDLKKLEEMIKHNEKTPV
ncbi:hypothetical protein BSNK01_13120 [Bacillaceae bacterium]